jgi:DKNYY family
MKVCIYLIVLVTGIIQACTSAPQAKTVKQNAATNLKQHSTDTLDQYDLADSNMLVHIKDQFYQSKGGRLYERTFAQRVGEGVDTLMWVEYFSGQIPQDLDPLSFEALDGWFAKDKNFAYYYRPVSGGMLISKLTDADAKSFQVLKGDYRYAIDKTNVYEETQVLKGLSPAALQVLRNSKGNIINLVSGSASHAVEPVE